MKNLSLKRLVNRLAGLGKDTLDMFTQSKAEPAEQLIEMCRAILSLEGEASAIVIAEEFLRLYEDLGADQKCDFLLLLSEEFVPSTEAVEEAIADWQTSRTQTALQNLSDVTESPRQELFRTLNMADQGTAALIGIREDILHLIKKHEVLEPVNTDLLHLFKSWFNRGFLELRRIDWQTPAYTLEKLIEYESVHEIQGWDDLRRRLQDDRRCYAFFHPVIPHIPLIFVEVALTRNVSSSISRLLKKPDEEAPTATTAVFYSINNCLRGLRGVSFGNLLIKQVVARLAVDCPDIKTYATLSPVPGFRHWLDTLTAESELITEEQQALIQKSSELANEKQQLATEDEFHNLCMKLCAHYLVNEKSRGNPADAVARFHLGNGARLEHINWEADMSANGLKQSFGIMVNYLYDLDQMASNHERYQSDNEVIYSSDIGKLLNGKT